jgi:DNA invertase Pin-like site-specific DNA recombinase
MKAYYIRVSTIEQNTARQEYIVPEGYKVFKDKCSGSIPFKERTAGGVLFKHILNNEVEELKVHSIDRLGRDTLDIMNTIQISTSKGVNVVSHKEGLQTLIDGKENPTAKLMIGILATLSEFEKNRIKERQQEGIARAKERGVYKTNGGNKKAESESVFMNKPKVQKVIKYLKQGESVRRCAKLSECSVSLVQKVKKIYDKDTFTVSANLPNPKDIEKLKAYTEPILSEKELKKAVKKFEGSYISLILGVEGKDNLLEYEKEERYKKANDIYSNLTQQVKNEVKPIIEALLPKSERYFFDSSKLIL